MSYTKEILETFVTNTNATLIGELPALKKEARIAFRCRCGTEDSKTFVRIKETGVLCKTCTNIQRRERREATNLVKYGTTCTLQNDVIKAKAAATCLERYNAENPFKSDTIKERIKKTNLEKYGSENPYGSKIIIQKIRQICEEKYGEKFPMKNPEIANKTKLTNLLKYGVPVSSKAECVKEKAKQTNLRKYGKEHHIIPEIISKMKHTNLLKYGVEYTFQSLIVKQRIRESLLKKYGVSHTSLIKDIYIKKQLTCIKKYGVIHHFQCESILRKQHLTNIVRYGTPYPQQSPIIQAKSQKTGLRYKTYTTPSGEIRKVQGYEPRALDILFKEQKLPESDVLTSRSDVPVISYTSNSKSHRYFPDIYIPSQNKIIEVKSTWTFNLHFHTNRLKWKATKDAGYLCEFWIFTKTGYSVHTEI